MKYIAIMLSFCLSLNVLAASGTVSELERALDEYQYTVTVDWDQKDHDFHEIETKLFFERIAALVSDQGLSKDEILLMAEKKMANKKAFEALKLKLSLLSDLKSSDELAKVLRENSKEFYGQGASWAPDATEVLMWVGVAAVIGYLIWFSATHECVAWSDKWVCDTTDTSYGSTTSCGWKSYCTRYQKK